MDIRSTGEDAYFAASNSAGGFCSYYGECFDAPSINRVYAVKGGPGTGKSYFLRAVAEAARKKGWRAEYIYCSSDPDSLDGLRLFSGKEGIALLDATAPHVYEPMHPGVREELVDLGAFWNPVRLAESRERIAALHRQKKEAYGRAYRYLSGVESMTHLRDELVAPFIKRERILSFAARLAAEIPRGRGFSCEIALMHSIGMQGRVGFDTYLAKASRILRIEDCRGAGQYLLDAFGNLAPTRGWQMRVSHDPILADRPDGFFLPESGVAMVICPEEECTYPHRRISMRRFVETARMHGVREELNRAERTRRAMLAGAEAALREVRPIHGELERIYGQAMDFGAKEEFTKSFCECIFGRA